MNQVIDTILKRRSTRSYRPDALTKEQLDAVVNAGLWAPTARNQQEIYMAVVTDRALMEEFIGEYLERDPKGKRFGRFNYDAPAFIFLFGPGDFKYTDIDGGIAVENMALAAEAVGAASVIIGCIKDFMAGENGARWSARLGAPENSKFVVGLAVGIGDKATPPRDRKPDRVKYF